ncbi:histidine kinase-like ATPase, partial [Suillus americanus]
VEVNQQDLVDKVLACYPEELTVLRELLQNADDAGAENFEVVFESTHGCASDGTTPALTFSSNKVFRWLVKNDGAQFQDTDWKCLTKIGNPDEQKIGAFGVGFFSVFSVTDKPIVKSNDTPSFNEAYMKEQLNCNRNKWTVIEMELKQGSTILQIFELMQFLVTSVTYLANIQHVRIFLDGIELSCLTKTWNKAIQSIAIWEYIYGQKKSGWNDDH